MAYEHFDIPCPTLPVRELAEPFPRFLYAEVPIYKACVGRSQELLPKRPGNHHLAVLQSAIGPLVPAIENTVQQIKRLSLGVQVLDLSLIHI